MTSNRNFKRLVRRRMEATGERYAVARAHLVAQEGDRPGSPDPGSPLFDGVVAVGGQQPDVAAARNLCHNAGVTGPDGGPLTEALAFGLCGGVGFLYGQFTYGDDPTLTIVARNASMPDPFLEPLFARVGAETTIATTGGPTRAAKDLDRVLADGRPALCTVGAGVLPYLGCAPDLAASAPHVVGVVGVAPDGEVLVDDRSPVPIAIERATFDEARGAYRKAKNRLITIDGTDPDHDWASAVAGAVRAGAVGFDTPPVPQFASNVGLAGLEKFRRLLTDRRDPKGWPTVFAAGSRAALGLSRLVDGIDREYTAPAAGRPLQADFLVEAASLVEDDAIGAERLLEAADGFRASGRSWSAMVATVNDADPALARYGELSARWTDLLDDGADGAAMAAIVAEQQGLIEDCALSPEAAGDVYGTLADHLGRAIDDERRALAILSQP